VSESWVAGRASGVAGRRVRVRVQGKTAGTYTKCTRVHLVWLATVQGLVLPQSLDEVAFVVNTRAHPRQQAPAAPAYSPRIDAVGVPDKALRNVVDVMSLCQAARGEERVGRLGAVHAAVSVAPSRQFLYTPFPIFIASATHGETKCGESAICFKLRHHGLGLIEGHSVVIHPHPPPLIRRAVDSDHTHPRNNEI
jgi:hypothetical protein